MSDSTTPNTALPECDIVMKGGITSGLVYPPAILQLSQKYRFCSIGGASAGGIVAALTAAAEYSRQKGDPKAFDRMQAAAAELQAKGRLKNLFQPSTALRAPLNVFLAILKGTSAGSRAMFGISGLITNTPVSFLLGLAVGALFWLGTSDAIGALLHPLGMSLPPWLAIATRIVSLPLFLLAGGFLGGALAVVIMLLFRLPGQDFGICPCHVSAPRPTADKPLTDWLHEKINEVAQRTPEDPPLTVRDLDSVGITVRMMTSNISQGQPFVLPFRDRIFLFNEAEMRGLFPKSVVDHLVATAHKTSRLSPPAGWYFMPAPPDFPLIVAARLSLSFPVLIATVPLYTVRCSAYARAAAAPDRALTADDLQRNLFSDGGISSNFPIQFFDSWYPDRPTFGINLTNWPQEAFADKQSQRFSTNQLALTPTQIQEPIPNAPGAAPLATSAVFLPAANTDSPPEIQTIDNLGGFIMAIFSTAQNYRDNAQTHLPSYRERIVQVRLKDDEGGLNLDMDADMIEQMLKKGQSAGTVLRDDFQMDRHQWVRLLVLMQQLERQLHDLRGVLTPVEFERLVTSMRAAADAKTPFPYSRDAAWVKKAEAAMPHLFELMENWKDVNCFAYKHPHPASVLRVSPDYDVYPDGPPTAAVQ